MVFPLITGKAEVEVGISGKSTFSSFMLGAKVKYLRTAKIITNFPA